MAHPLQGLFVLFDAVYITLATKRFLPGLNQITTRCKQRGPFVLKNYVLACGSTTLEKNPTTGLFAQVIPLKSLKNK